MANRGVAGCQMTACHAAEAGQNKVGGLWIRRLSSRISQHARFDPQNEGIWYDRNNRKFRPRAAWEP